MKVEYQKSGTGFVIHNGLRHQWNYLEVIDRANGEIELIRLDDANSVESVAMAAETNRLSLQQAWEILLDGGTIATFGFCRRLKK